MGHDAITNWALLTLGRTTSEDVAEDPLPLEVTLGPRKSTTDGSETRATIPPGQRGRANSETAAQPFSLASTRK